MSLSNFVWCCVCSLALGLGPAAAQPGPAPAPASDAPAPVLAALDLAAAFVEAGHPEDAATECLRALHAAPSHPLGFYAAYCAGRFGMTASGALASASLLPRAVRAAPAHFRDAMRYQLALAQARLGDTEVAKLGFFELAVTTRDSTLAAASLGLAGLLYLNQYDGVGAAEAFANADLHQPQTCFEQAAGPALALEDPLPKNPATAKWLSTFVPGLGQAYAGDPLDGLHALGLNGGTSYLVGRAFARGGVRDGLLLASNLWFRYYQGNRLHAEAAAINVNEVATERRLRDAHAAALDAFGCLSEASHELEWSTVRAWYAAQHALSDRQ